MATKLPPVYRPPGISVNGNTDPNYGALVPYPTKSPTNGPKYMLHDSNTIYKLPQPKSLRPYVDSTAGVLDTWPAHTGGPGQTGPLSIGNKSAPKPKFLEHLEGFLQKELRALDCNDPRVPSERRLQAFREVFECLIEDFKTYRPILSAIKNEYELMIVLQREKIRELEPYKTSLVTVSEQCEQKIVALKQEERGEIADLKRENERLRQTILKMRDEQVSLNEQVKKLQIDVADEYKKYRDECDARKLLLQDLNDMKYQNEDGRRTSMTMAEEEGQGSGNEDGTLLRIALRKAREDLETKTMQLAEVLADYGDVVPRRDYEKLETDFKNIQSEMAEMKSDFYLLQKDHSSLIEVHKKIVEQRDQYFSDCEQLRRSGTPRPSWGKCAKYIEGGQERWDLISRNKSSDHLVDVLLSEMTGQDIAIIQAGTGNVVEYFHGLGLGPEIPSLFRWEGKVHNRRLNKRDTQLLVKDIWSARISSVRSPSPEKEEKKDDTFLDFLGNYLRGRYGSEELAVEWAYNLHDACQRYNHDSKIGTFNGILNGQLEEDVYHDNMALVDDLLRVFATADEHNKGFISKDAFTYLLSEYFTRKDRESLDILVATAESESDVTEDGISYVHLLTEGDDGEEGVFMSRLLEQRYSEKLMFIRKVEEQLQGKGLLSPDDAKEAFQAIYPDLNDVRCTKLISKGFQTPVDKLKSALQLDLLSFINNLKASSI